VKFWVGNVCYDKVDRPSDIPRTAASKTLLVRHVYIIRKIGAN